MAASASFAWPALYSFPPFFTQVAMMHNFFDDSALAGATEWKDGKKSCSKILTRSCITEQRRHAADSLDVQEALTSPLFNNQTINRHLSPEAVRIVLDELAAKGNVEWTGRDKSRCRVLWRTIEQWAAIIYSWVENNGMTGTVCTLYELQAGDHAVGTEMYGIDENTLKEALAVLQAQRKAQVFSSSTGELDGVKFF
ncbi:hypothetical protein CAOG_01143 [Capsaspora owczarzaki ATCC 30864]|uniref:ESCRT-II complex subunit VPS25 n=1 Tax=Capsaspora owczarzaki (strain ATCC 30864) TaxID=595528 RepID=A0A0D2VIC5_CAPO3|nr:hypothetical protein CAOG_01143 [Capsaspora owczarzaki ATCC 30864]KJE89712.1 hypothetical protein CAOG_001143 [Capsaspora owczarzaki ATCC 30864]|eukprot:XP_004366014.1 hypothetical protein CAOG_01143 [Capsaspora owczarzaki ATCC 30864]